MNSPESKTPTGSTSQPTSPESATTIYTEFWQAPPRFWKPRVRELEEEEMEAIMSGGASSY